MEKISIIIPAYNEEKRIGSTLEIYQEFFENARKKKLFQYEILVVINNTQDNTEKIVKKFSKSNKNIKYLNFKKGGKGFAIIEGFKQALKDKNNDLIGFVDADMATSPKDYYNLIKNIGANYGIIGSRYISKAIVKPKQSFQRIFASRIFNFIIRCLFLFSYKDTQCGAKIFRRKVIEKIVYELSMTQWAFDVNLMYLCKKYKFKIKEYPTVWQDKEYSKINLSKAGPQMFLSVIRLRVINSFFEPLLRPLRFLSHKAHKILNREKNGK